MAGQLILGFAILVIVHEFGHFITARMFGIRVEKFFVFFDAGGFKLFSFKRGGTEYGAGWLPLGGYVKIAGMIDESFDKDFIGKEPEPWEFRAKPAWQRLIVMLGGIIMNILLAIIIFWGHTAYFGETFIPASELKYGIMPGEVGQAAGLMEGDKILSINGNKIERSTDLTDTRLVLDDKVDLEILRGGEQMTLTLPPSVAKRLVSEGLTSFYMLRFPFHVGEVSRGTGADEAGLKAGDKIYEVDGKSTFFYHEFEQALKGKENQQVNLGIDRDGTILQLKVQASDKGKLGFIAGNEFKTTTVRYGFFESFSMGVQKAWKSLTDTVRGLWRIIRGKLPARESLNSVIGIANIYGGQWNWNSFWAITGLLSMVLAFMNLLPIPALDGGHVVFTLIEMIRGKAVSYRVLDIAQRVGVAIIFLLMGFALFNDFSKYVF